MTLSSTWLNQIRSVMAALDHQEVATARSVLTDLYTHLQTWEPYLESVSTPESPVLADLWAKTQTIDWEKAHEEGLSQNRLMAGMVSGHLVGQLLKMLIQLSGAKHILEVGTFVGYSALAMAEVLPPDGQVIACEFDAYAAEIAQSNFRSAPWGNKICLRLGPAQTTLLHLAEEGATFDFVFLDADKRGYSNYFQTLLDRNLLRPGGLLCADNTLFSGQVWGTNPGNIAQAIDAFNRVVSEDDRVEQVLLPLRDGLSLIRRR